MARAPFQVLVLPFRMIGIRNYEFCALRRSERQVWQGVAGGGEDDETPAEAAIRESREEIGVSELLRFYQLDNRASIPASIFPESELWSADIIVIPEYSFAIDCSGIELIISSEHDALVWGSYDLIYRKFHWDSNRTALWELNKRLEIDRMLRL